MAGLLDIAPVAEKFSVRGTEVEVYGISAKGIAMLLDRFPELRMMMTGKEVEIDRLWDIGIEAVCAIIAAGCGSPGNEEAENAAGNLTFDEQADLLTAILRRTLPNGIGPFVEKLTALGAVLGAEGGASPKVPATKSPKR